MNFTARQIGRAFFIGVKINLFKEYLMDKRFEQLLLKYAKSTTENGRETIKQQLWQRFGAHKAVFVMDMSGFSRLTQKYGIVHYLSMVRRMQLVTEPIVEQHAGQVIKFEADNCFAAFDSPHNAVRAAIAINIAFSSMNIFTADEFDIRVSIGIDDGDVLMIGGPDYFGNPVNCACKLGEDIAAPGEILVSEHAFQQIPAEAGIQGKFLHISISGIELNTYSITF
jgi:adenylate cyclase